MKPFEVYQYLDGEEMTERDKNEIGSKFWNRGKWDNFVAPFLPDDCSGMTLVDMGCNAGLFLKFAEEKSFGQVIGVDGNEEAVRRGLEWRDKHKGTYKIICSHLHRCIDNLPLADFTILVNSHYYFTINDWFDYLDKLQTKTRYCIIVTAEKRHKNVCWASADVPDIRSYFKNWDETGFIDELPTAGDPAPRRLWGLCFKSRFIDKIPADSLICRNSGQEGFFEEIDKGIEYKNTAYYKFLREGYRKKWSERRLDRWMQERIAVFLDLKKNSLLKPIIVDSNNVILDGNHRYEMMKHLGYKNIFIRRAGAQQVAVDNLKPAPALRAGIKLNLGCGKRLLRGFDNLDKNTGWMFQDGLSQYTDGTVDAVTISHTLMYLDIPELQKFMKEAYRVLKPGGVVRITEDDTENPLSDTYQTGYVRCSPRCLTGPKMMRGVLEGAGFKTHDVDESVTHFCDKSLMQNYHRGRPRCFFIEGIKN